MAYIKKSTPGWRPNFRGLGAYVRKSTPGWRPNFRGLGYVEKLVVSGLGCACKKNITLGQDENFGVPTSLVDFSAPTAQYPTSNASAYTPSGPEPYLPTSGASSYWGSRPSLLAPGETIELPTGAPLPPIPPVPSTGPMTASQYAAATTPPSALEYQLASFGLGTNPETGGMTTNDILLGALGLVVIVALASTGRRR